jgi:hypothetical protein
MAAADGESAVRVPAGPPVLQFGGSMPKSHSKAGCDLGDLFRQAGSLPYDGAALPLDEFSLVIDTRIEETGEHPIDVTFEDHNAHDWTNAERAVVFDAHPGRECGRSRSAIGHA